MDFEFHLELSSDGWKKMMNKRITTEHALYALALLLALGVRFLNLGAAPLSDAEAVWALQALGIARGEPVLPGPQPAYLILTGLAFSLFGSSDVLARFWPALVGSGLALLPVFFRRQIGREAALILAFGLALDPGLVTLSRLAGGPALAAGFSLLALALFAARRPVLAGISAALALLSGPDVLHGLLGIGLAWAGGVLLARAGLIDPLAGLPEDGRLNLSGYRQAALAFLAALLVVGTLFLRFPQGLGAWASTLPAYLGGWATASGTPALRLLAGLAIYQPLALIFGLVGAIMGWAGRPRLRTGDSGDQDHSPFPRSAARLLSLWFVFALLLALLYPSREMAHLAWALIPLWALAAIGLAGLLFAPLEHPVTSLGHAGLILVLLALFWLNLAGMGGVEPGAQAVALRLGLLAGVIALAGLSTVLVALGWSWAAARNGLLWGFSAALLLFMIAGMWRSSQLRPPVRPSAQELWDVTPVGVQQDLLLKTLAELSRWEMGRLDAIDVVVEVDAPSLRWALRGFKQAQFVAASQPQAVGTGWPQGGSPAVLISGQTVQEPSLPASYRGQDFVWWENPAWDGALPPDFTRWLVSRQAPVQQEQVILWARSDLFPGEDLTEAEAAAPGQEDRASELERQPFE